VEAVPSRAAVGELRLATTDDQPAILALYQDLSPASQRMRFSVTMSDKELRRAAELGDRFEAVIALDRGQVVGEARLEITSGSEHEFALTVADRVQRRGIGRALLDRLREHADARGIVTMRAQVRIDNIPMLTLLRRVGGSLVLVAGGDVLFDIASDRQMPGWSATSVRTRVLVEAPGLLERSITTRLRAAGYDVRQCGGPTAAGRRDPCPVLAQGRCRLAQDADAIICLLPEDDDDSRAIVSSHALHRPGSLAAGLALSRQ
jgi:GNAT superfamily N-acetyltransferase